MESDHFLSSVSIATMYKLQRFSDLYHASSVSTVEIRFGHSWTLAYRVDVPSAFAS